MSKEQLYSHTKEHQVGKSMTKQDGAQTPAQVWRKFMQGQPLPESPPPVYGDISQFDYAAVRNQVAEFETMFEELPSDLRASFGNDASQYAEFLGEKSTQIESDGLYAVLSDRRRSYTLDEDGYPVKDTQGPSGPENAQNGATEDEPGTDQTS